MRDFDAIRGKKPTKTELILEYLLNHPNEVLTPKEVADGLGFNLQTTVTVLNRLAMEGAIAKKSRGRFCYLKKVKPKTQKKVKVTPIKMEKKRAASLYKAIYTMAGESAGPEVVRQITGLSLNDFDKKAPIESIQKLVESLKKLLGEEIAHDIVNIAIENEFTEEESLELRDQLHT